MLLEYGQTTALSIHVSFLKSYGHTGTDVQKSYVLDYKSPLAHVMMEYEDAAGPKARRSAPKRTMRVLNQRLRVCCCRDIAILRTDTILFNSGWYDSCV